MTGAVCRRCVELASEARYSFRAGVLDSTQIKPTCGNGRLFVDGDFHHRQLVVATGEFYE